MEVNVIISLKKGVADPEGSNVKKALNNSIAISLAQLSNSFQLIRQNQPCTNADANHELTSCSLLIDSHRDSIGSEGYWRGLAIKELSNLAAVI